MKKAKKYIYPFIFSICFFLTYIILGIALEIVLPSGDYAGLAYAGFALIIWISVVVPIYCVIYSKIIREEKLKFLFVFYNPLIVTCCYTFPFLDWDSSSSDSIIKIAIFIFIWIAVWTFIPLLIPLDSTKKQDDNISNKTEDSVTKV